MRRPRGDDGNALLEFSYLAVLLMVPLVYVLLAVFQVQRAAFGVTEAARQAGRAVVVATDLGSAQERAAAAARLALSDQGLDGVDPPQLTCSADPCLTPGATVTVRVEHRVELPVLSLLFPGEGGPSIPVSATHVAVVDAFREAP